MRLEVVTVNKCHFLAVHEIYINNFNWLAKVLILPHKNKNRFWLGIRLFRFLLSIKLLQLVARSVTRNIKVEL